MSKTKFKASAQGTFDGLCGIYAIINACNLVMGGRLDRDYQCKLFCKLTNLLDDGRQIGEIVHEGIDVDKLGELIDVASRDLALTHKTKINHSSPSTSAKGKLADFWCELSDNVKPEQSRIAILSVEGKHSHWTVIHKVSDKSLTLADSDNLKRFNKVDCSLKKAKKTHRLRPKETYFLRAVAI